MLPCLWNHTGNFPSCGQHSPNISGNLQCQHWRCVVSSESVSTQSESKGSATCLFLGNCAVKVVLNIKGVLSLISHWKESFLLLVLTYLNSTKETLLSLSAVEMPEKWWDEHTRSIYKIKLFKPQLAEFQFRFFQTSCLSVIFEETFL